MPGSEFKLRVTNEGEITSLHASGRLLEHHPPVINAGLAKLVNEGRRKIILNLSSLKDLNLRYLAELAKGCKQAFDKGGMIFIVGVSAESRELIEKGSASEWVNIGEDIRDAKARLEEMQAPKLSGEALQGALEGLRKRAAGLDLEKGRELRRKHGFLLQRVSEMKILLKQWENDLPHPGEMPGAEEFYEAESSLLQRMAQLGVMPNQFFKEATDRWEENQK